MSRYAPQSGRSCEKCIYNEVRNAWDMHNVDKLVVKLMDMWLWILIVFKKGRVGQRNLD